MKMALHGLMWHDAGIEAVRSHLEDLGVARVDVGALPNCGHMDLRAGAGPAEARRVRGALSAEIEVVAVTADHPGVGAADAKSRDAAVSWLREAAAAARELRAPVVGLALGGAAPGDVGSALGRAAGSLRDLLVAEPDMRVSVELHVENVCDSLDKAEWLLEAVDSDRIGLTFDTSLLYYHAISHAEAFGRLGDRLFHVHLRGASRRGFFDVPGRDDVDFAGFLEHLSAAEYEGALALELYGTREAYGLDPRDAAEEALAYLRGLGYP